MLQSILFDLLARYKKLMHLRYSSMELISRVDSIVAWVTMKRRTSRNHLILHVLYKRQGGLSAITKLCH
jgi:hypothetical protein